MARLLRSLVAMLVVSLLLASCSSAPRFHSGSRGIEPSEDSRSPVDPERQELVDYAKSFLGVPYRAGGASRSGVDCSGLVLSVYGHFNVPLPRTSLDQSRVGEVVDRTNVAPGDLVFFKTSRQTVSHVGIYVGGGRFIHASTSARRVRIDEMDDDYFRNRFVVARRVID